jgi:chromosome partitioning protein
MTISIASQKGGTGKTTTSISLAAGLAHKGKKVLLIDVDSQANSSKVLLPNYSTDIKKEQTVYNTIIKRQPLSIHPTSIRNLDIAPAHILLSSTDVELTVAKDHREARLKRELDPLKGSYDFIFLDCPPALGWLTLNALTASEKVLVMVSPGYFEVEAIDQIADTIRETKTDYNPDLELIGLLFTMTDQTINTSTSLSLLKHAYPTMLLPRHIPRNTDLRDAHYSHQDIFTFNPKAYAAISYDKLIHELFLPNKTSV